MSFSISHCAISISEFTFEEIINNQNNYSQNELYYNHRLNALFQDRFGPNVKTSRLKRKPGIFRNLPISPMEIFFRCVPVTCDPKIDRDDPTSLYIPWDLWRKIFLGGGSKPEIGGHSAVNSAGFF